MINNFEEYLTLENIFLISNWGVIPFWLLLLFFPNVVITRFLVHSIIAPLLLSIAYIFIVYQIYLNNNNEKEYRKSTDSRNILHYIVHFGDWMSTVAEKQHYVQGNIKKLDKVEETKKEFNKKNLDVDDMKSEFDKLFAN